MALELNRLFFALWPEEDVRECIAKAARDLRMRMQPGGRPLDPERFHLTMLFLGSSVSDAQEATLRQLASAIRLPPFELCLDQAGSFRKSPLPWWLGSQQPTDALQRLHERLKDAASRSGIAADRTRFAPHVTIQRNAGKALATTPIAPIKWQVSEFALVRSHLDTQPPVYEVVVRWPLTGQPEREASGVQQMGLWDN